MNLTLARRRGRAVRLLPLLSGLTCGLAWPWGIPQETWAQIPPGRNLQPITAIPADAPPAPARPAPAANPAQGGSPGNRRPAAAPPAVPPVGRAGVANGANRGLPQQGPGQGAGNVQIPVMQPLNILPPFRLSAEERAALDTMLLDWEASGDRVNTFRCKLRTFEYEATNPRDPITEGTGYICYKKPDKGELNIERTKSRNLLANKPGASKQELWSAEVPGAHFICTGTEVHEVQHPRPNQQGGKVIIRQIPPQMRGQMIVYGPLPFLFGMKAKDLKERYSMRIETKPEDRQVRVTLHVIPLWANDAENFSEAFVNLSRSAQGLMPEGVKLIHPNGASTSYIFSDLKVNPAAIAELFKGMFQAPSVPKGYQRIFEQPPAEAAQAAPEGSPGAPRAPAGLQLRQAQAPANGPDNKQPAGPTRQATRLPAAQRPPGQAPAGKTAPGAPGAKGGATRQQPAETPIRR